MLYHIQSNTSGCCAAFGRFISVVLAFISFHKTLAVVRIEYIYIYFICDVSGVSNSSLALKSSHIQTDKICERLISSQLRGHSVDLRKDRH